MPYAVNAVLDPAGASEIERRQGWLVRNGVAEADIVSQYGACVTLIVAADSVHPDDLCEALAYRLARFAALDVALTEPCLALGSPSTLGLRVGPTAALLSLHNALFNILHEQQVHLHYRPAHWQPHVKLANARSDMSSLIDACTQEWRPAQATLDRLEVIAYPPVQSIWQAPLRRAGIA